MADRHAGEDEAGTAGVHHPLRAKAAVRRDGGPDGLFEAADDAVAVQAADYLRRAQAECAAARDAIDMALGHGGERIEALDRLYDIAHDMKGQAATFGYPLAGDICARLCRLLRRRPDLDEAALKIVQAHVAGLAVVLDHAIAGDGGPLGRRLADRLGRLADRATP